MLEMVGEGGGGEDERRKVRETIKARQKQVEESWGGGGVKRLDQYQ